MLSSSSSFDHIDIVACNAAGVSLSVTDGELTAGHGRALLGTPDRALQESLAATVVAQGLSVRATEELVRSGGVVEEPFKPSTCKHGGMQPANAFTSVHSENFLD